MEPTTPGRLVRACPQCGGPRALIFRAGGAVDAECYRCGRVGAHDNLAHRADDARQEADAARYAEAPGAPVPPDELPF